MAALKYTPTPNSSISSTLKEFVLAPKKKMDAHLQKTSDRHLFIPLPNIPSLRGHQCEGACVCALSMSFISVAQSELNGLILILRENLSKPIATCIKLFVG
ncbi:unnamed protein product [Mortierella alpina]